MAAKGAATLKQQKSTANVITNPGGGYYPNIPNPDSDPF